jgi:hypothetical protein
MCTTAIAIHIFQRPSGNSAAAALRRLERYRPDILNRVLAGEMSAHAGMIEAGFRKRPPRPLRKSRDVRGGVGDAVPGVGPAIARERPRAA